MIKTNNHRRRDKRWVYRLAVVLAVSLMAVGGAERSPFAENQKAFYLPEHELAFIRPGLNVNIVEASIDAEGTIRARFTITDPKGLPLDRAGVFTPGSVSTSFIAAVLPAGEDLLTAYTTRTATSPITNDSAVQASSDSGGSYEKVGDGEYVYTFNTRAPGTIDRSATHRIGVYSSRDLREFELDREFDDDTFDFTPDATTPVRTHQAVSTENCNTCHNQLGLHGGSRRSVELCVMCHTPQSTDPDTGNTVDFATMIHKIHRGADLPSVQDGTPYQIIGYRQSVHDYSTVEFPADVRNCETCHLGPEASNLTAKAETVAALRPRAPRARLQAQPDHEHVEEGPAYLTEPSRRACGACHDNVNFATGEHHASLPQVSDNQCSTCHIPEGELEFDVSIKGAHTIPRLSKKLPGTNFEILSVSDSAPGQNPTVSFSIRDNEGNPVAPSDMGRLALVISGNTNDFSRFFSENAKGAEGSGGVYFYTFETPIPADAQGSWAVGVEGYQNVTLLAGTLQERSVRHAGDNQVFYFPVTDAEAKPRRAVVAQQKCDSCHFDLDIHGSNRNEVEHCVLCHNPMTTDARRRPEDQFPAESVHFKTMIHKIHTGEELETNYDVFGFGSTLHDFNEVRFPGDRRDCSTCHLSGTEQADLPQGLLSTNAPRDYLNPMPPISGACLSCHTSLSAAAHADLNISAKLGESCAVCHGPGAEFSVDRVHAQ